MTRARAAVVLGVAAVVAVALVWFRVLPGRSRLGTLLRDRAAEDARATRRAEALARWRRENASAPAGAVVFLGSSTIERGAWSDLFPRARCLNRGLADETADRLLERLDASLPAARPAVFVVYAGSADLRMAGVPPSTAAARAVAVGDALRVVRGGAFADVPIVFLEVLPEVAASPARNRDLAELNALIEDAASERGWTFVRTHVDALRDASGNLRPELSTDGVHLNETGYRALALRLASAAGPASRVLAP